MFSSSSQLKFWTFSGNGELVRLRKEANHKYISSHVHKDRADQLFLTVEEERILCRHYEYVIKEFCGHFQPPMPSSVVGTSLHYFKRFYLHNSVMDYHPKYAMYTCVYMACKVEEFNVSITQFCNNISEMVCTREQGADTILNQELLLLQQLHYHLTIHNPYRPLEGLLIDIKTRCKEVTDGEKLRKGAEDFLDISFNSDVCLLFAPSQIALAAVLSSASRNSVNLDHYVYNTLLTSDEKENLEKTVEHVKRIKFNVKSIPQLDREEVKLIESKLKYCQNPENNPESEQYHTTSENCDEEEREDDKAHKRRRLSQDSLDESGIDDILGP